MDILKAREKAAEQKRAREKMQPAHFSAAPSVKEVPPCPEEAAPAPAVTAMDVSASSIPAIEHHMDDPHSEDEEGDARADEIELLSFRLAGEAYALLVKDVREVLKIRSLTPVPNAPSYILGVTALRGTVLPVIDLCVRFGLPSGIRDDKSRIIVAHSGEEDVGLVVDRVTGVLRTMPDAIKPTPENIEQGAAFLRGIVRKDEKLYILLDLEKAVGA